MLICVCVFNKLRSALDSIALGIRFELICDSRSVLFVITIYLKINTGHRYIFKIYLIVNDIIHKQSVLGVNSPLYLNPSQVVESGQDFVFACFFVRKSNLKPMFKSKLKGFQLRLTHPLKSKREIFNFKIIDGSSLELWTNSAFLAH